VHAPGHSPLGVLEYCLLPSLFILAIWYGLVERYVLALINLPQRQWAFNLSRFWLLNVGVLIGAFSQLLWDASSHQYGHFVTGGGFWSWQLFSLPMYKIIQYGSSIVGISILLVYYWYLPKIYSEAKFTRLAIGILIIFALAGVIVANYVHGFASLRLLAVRSSIGIISGFAIGLLVYAALMKAMLTNKEVI
jgi:hypothetical protein